MISNKGFIHLAFAAVALVVICLQPAQATTGKAQIATITMKDGTVYEKVSFSIDNYYKILKIEYPDGKKNLSFGDVASIVDADGNDITQELLKIGPSEKPEKEPTVGTELQREKGDEGWLSDNHEVHVKAREKFWKAGFSIGSNYSFPLGDYYEGATGGLGFQIELIIPVSSYIAIRGTVSKANWGTESGLVDYYYDSYSGYSVSANNYDFSAMRFFVSGQYYHCKNSPISGTAIPYAYTGLGAIKQTISADMTIYDESDVPQYEERSEVSETKFAVTLGGGVVLMVSPTVGIDLGGSFDEVFLGSDSEGSGVNYAFVFDLKAGLKILIR